MKDEQLRRYLDDELAPSERAEFERRLSEDETLRRQAEAHRALASRLRVEPNYEPPADLADRVMNRIAKPKKRTSRGGMFFLWALITLGVALGVLTGVAATNGGDASLATTIERELAALGVKRYLSFALPEASFRTLGYAGGLIALIYAYFAAETRRRVKSIR
jgi:anti-sigma factor RsiW